MTCLSPRRRFGLAYTLVTYNEREFARDRGAARGELAEVTRLPSPGASGERDLQPDWWWC
jgi:hypothetical protein